MNKLNKLILWFKSLDFDLILGRIFIKDYYLKKQIKKADELFNRYRKQYFVMPFDNKGHSIVVHGASFLTEFNRKAKKTGARQLSYMDLVNMCQYKTPNGKTNIK